MRVLIVGCGYVGLPLGAELAQQGHEVYGVRRSAARADELTAAGIRPLVADVTQPDTLRQLPAPFDWVVNCVSSSKGSVEDYRAVYLAGTRRLIDWLAATPPRKFVYTSSTSVYGQTDGSAVKETHPTEPPTETGRVLVETEQVWLAAARERGFPAVVLRVAGIYGPDRGHYFKQFLNNEARLEGRGERLLNMIHRDDVVGAILAALKSGRPGEVYNAVDDEPVAQIHLFRWLSETLGKNMPPQATEAEATERKRGFTSKKVSNRRLKMELGYQFKYPTFRQGLTEEIRRLDRAGLLNIELESREHLSVPQS
jgi:nucleoside-diphosphate-sugar epimerase